MVCNIYTLLNQQQLFSGYRLRPTSYTLCTDGSTAIPRIISTSISTSIRSDHQSPSLPLTTTIGRVTAKTFPTSTIHRATEQQTRSHRTHLEPGLFSRCHRHHDRHDHNHLYLQIRSTSTQTSWDQTAIPPGTCQAYESQGDDISDGSKMISA